MSLENAQDEGAKVTSVALGLVLEIDHAKSPTMWQWHGTTHLSGEKNCGDSFHTKGHVYMMPMAHHRFLHSSSLSRLGAY